MLVSNRSIMAPVTRSRTHSSDSGADAQPPLGPMGVVKMTARLSRTLTDLADTDPVHGKDAKALRDAAAQAIHEVWKDSENSTALLAQKVNQGNSSLISGINDSFSAVGIKIDSLSMVATFSPDGQLPRISPYTGSGDNVTQFSIWLRRLEDVLRMRSPPLNSEQKANFLIGYLDGVAREKIEELSPQQKYMACQSLASCKQEPGESSTVFANRLLNLLDNPATFEQAVTKAQTVEQLLSEAAAERLMNPAAAAPTPIEVKAAAPQNNWSRVPNNRPNYFRSASPRDRQPRFQPRGRAQFRRPVQPRSQPTTCYTYGGTLVSGADAAERRLLLHLFEFPEENLPFLFVDVAGTSQPAVTKSHFNEAEATVCLTTVTELTGKGVRADQICVITFYREQYRKLAEPLRKMGIELSTVDTVQGREKDVVILLTTKTGFDPEAAEFLDEQRRMNVALTRSRHGQFVLGHVESLRQVRYWSGVLEMATEHNAVLPASDLPRFFRSD
ncbi:hypothetical protein ANCDUO_23602 [Ancylostoma duodenale]|uniref:DNA2/NAM7 helicase-like C-terminal domain-containing protein n=1 Tax=Ancylostoma duodenale TaxID=51022 RepID=A0A0C2C995_9BILA|nr:hypothetical protein ANCDUO_23602 [Ancylostoma duodenale]